MDGWKKLEDELDAEPVEELQIIEERPLTKRPDPDASVYNGKEHMPSDYDSKGTTYKTPIPPARPNIPEGRPAPPPRKTRRDNYE